MASRIITAYDDRIRRAQQLVAQGAVHKQADGSFVVESQSGNGAYQVDLAYDPDPHGCPSSTPIPFSARRPIRALSGERVLGSRPRCSCGAVLCLSLDPWYGRAIRSCVGPGVLSHGQTLEYNAKLS